MDDYMPRHIYSSSGDLPPPTNIGLLREYKFGNFCYFGILFFVVGIVPYVLASKLKKITAPVSSFIFVSFFCTLVIALYSPIDPEQPQNSSSGGSAAAASGDGGATLSGSSALVPISKSASEAAGNITYYYAFAHIKFYYLIVVYLLSSIVAGLTYFYEIVGEISLLSVGSLIPFFLLQLLMTTVMPGWGQLLTIFLGAAVIVFFAMLVKPSLKKMTQSVTCLSGGAFMMVLGVVLMMDSSAAARLLGGVGTSSSSAPSDHRKAPSEYGSDATAALIICAMSIGIRMIIHFTMLRYDKRWQQDVRNATMQRARSTAQLRRERTRRTLPRQV